MLLHSLANTIRLDVSANESAHVDDEMSQAHDAGYFGVWWFSSLGNSWSLNGTMLSLLLFWMVVHQNLHVC